MYESYYSIGFETIIVNLNLMVDMAFDNALIWESAVLVLSFEPLFSQVAGDHMQ
jgi:hypothetical protein